jgi:hypothetical protein
MQTTEPKQGTGQLKQSAKIRGILAIADEQRGQAQLLLGYLQLVGRR